MCGRIVYNHNEETRYELAQRLKLTIGDDFTLKPNYNGAPGITLPVIVKSTTDGNVVEAKQWGFVPPWAHDGRTKFANARIESAPYKNSFSNAFRNYRCIIPITGYYEWRTEGGEKQPYYIYSKTGKALTLAGLYNKDTFTILTMEASGPLTYIHERMPVVVAESMWNEWLDIKPLSQAFVDEMAALSRQQVDDLAFYMVTKDVNSVGNNREELLAPIEDV